jgi:hypothetical protein
MWKSMKFIASMQDEVGLFDRDTFGIIPISTMPSGTNPLRKCLPCLKIIKWKSIPCPHEGQKNASVNFWHTYAPLVKWSGVHLTFIMTTLLGLQSS